MQRSRTHGLVRSARTRTKTRLWTGVVLSLLFALQQVAIPLHLALHEHTWGASEVEATVVHVSHSHGHSHGHGHAHAHPGEGAHDEVPTDKDEDAGALLVAGVDGHHAPHPGQDHLKEHREPVSLTLTHDAALAPERSPLVDRTHDRVGWRAPLHRVEDPRPPPPPRASGPRAPPSAV